MGDGPLLGMHMKIWRWGYVGLAIALTACSSGKTDQTAATDTSPEVAPAEVTSCAPMETQVPLRPATETELPFEQFDFRPTEVDATDSTLTFKGSRYSFTLCKRDRTWGVQSLEPAAAPEEEDYLQYYESLANPDYATIAYQDQTYQARVRLDASWIDEEQDPSNSLEQVIFDLIQPGQEQPVSKVLYTNTDIVERELGATAGVPLITRSLVTEDSLWWSIGFEQGEGASGIATVIQYHVEDDQLTLWQPTELGNAQITDLALTNQNDETILWLGTQYSGEGNPYLPAKGLVAYRPEDNEIQSYTVENSPLVGAIPTRLWAENDALWVGTSSGVCEVDWASIEASDSWDCWRFTAMADLTETRDLYASLLAETPIEQLDTSAPVELLWLADTDISTPESTRRYEIRYEPGLVTSLEEGADYYVRPDQDQDDGYFWWPGREWSWNGQHFVRPWDQVAVNYVGGGPQGIGPSDYENYISNWHTMRGDFQLLELTPETTEIEHYSAWIDETEVEPWVTVTPVTSSPTDQPNPTEAVLTELKQAAR